MLYSPETNDFISRIRSRIDAGTATKEDLHAVVLRMRGERQAAAAAASASKSGKRAAKAPVNVDGLFDELDKI